MTIFSFLSKPNTLKHFSDRASWLLLVLEKRFWRFTGSCSAIAYGRASPSAECESERLHACIGEFHLECSIGGWFRLSDQLIQPLLDSRAVAVIVDVDTVSRTGRPTVNRDTKTHRTLPVRRSHHEMKVAGMKAVDDPSAGLVEQSGLASQRPVTPRAPTD